MEREFQQPGRAPWIGAAITCAGLFAGGVVGCTLPPPADGDEGEEESTGTGGQPEELRPSDLCSEAPIVSSGRWPGTLALASGEFGGACGEGGRDVFYKVQVPFRADLRVEAFGVGFVPRVGLLPQECLPDREFSCAEGLPALVPDVPAGSEVVIAIGIDPDDPALEGPSEFDDPLAFAVDVNLRRVLMEGEFCLPPQRGRCVSGTACLPGEDDEPGEEAFRCRAVPGETCAEPIDWDAGDPLVIDSSEVHSDDHDHSCTGLRRPERVMRLSLGAEVDGAGALEISSDRSDVGLALRAPGCFEQDEIACTAEGSTQTIELVDPGGYRLAGVDPLLFVELPDDPEFGSVTLTATLVP